MNVLLADHAHRVIKIPACSIRSIVGIAHAELPEDKTGCRSILRYDYGAGPMFAWLRTGAEQVMAQVAARMIAQPIAWVPLKTPEGDDVFLPVAAMRAVHEVDPAECAGANSRVDFDAFGDGREIKFALVVETNAEIEEAQAVAEQSVADRAGAPAQPPRSPIARKPARRRRA